MSDIKLKPCPFCGGEAKSHQTDVKPGYQTSWVRCTQCKAGIGHCDLQAEEAWNKRHGEESSVAAWRACSHILDQVIQNKKLRYFIGFGSQSLHLLLNAYALKRGVTYEAAEIEVAEAFDRREKRP